MIPGRYSEHRSWHKYRSRFSAYCGAYYAHRRRQNTNDTRQPCVYNTVQMPCEGPYFLTLAVICKSLRLILTLLSRLCRRVSLMTAYQQTTMHAANSNSLGRCSNPGHVSHPNRLKKFISPSASGLLRERSKDDLKRPLETRHASVLSPSSGSFACC